MTKYPNLSELLKYHPYGDKTACYHAEIEPELLDAVMNDGEPLEHIEIIRLSRLYQCPVGVLTHHKIIMLDWNKWKHKKMIEKVHNLYMQLLYMAKCKGNLEAKKYLEYADRENQKFLDAAWENRLSYGHYLGAYEQLSQYVRFSTPEPKRRGLEKKATPAADQAS